MRNLLSVLLFLSFMVTVAQKKSVSGTVKLDNEKHREFVVKNSYIILEAGKKKYRKKIDESLMFRFNNLRSNEISFSFEPKSNPNVSYSYSFDEADMLDVELKYSPICKYSKENKVCPNCKSEEFVVPIVYGLVFLKKEDADKYFLGGCVTFGCDPFWYCKKDDLRF